jgi:hypothetical protein
MTTSRTTRTRTSAKAAAQAALELLEANETQLPLAEAPAPTTAEPITEPEPAEVEQLDEGVITTVAPSELEPAWAKLPALSSAAQVDIKSYKIPFGAGAKTFAMSLDGGVTNEDSQLAQVAGIPVDLCLQISKSNSPDYEFDARLRLAFQDETGAMAELNFNALSQTREGVMYVTGPARSLIASLMAIAGTPDAKAFASGARFTLKQGNAAKSKSGRASTFVDMAVHCQHLNTWTGINSAQWYAIAPSTPETLVLGLEQLKLELMKDGLFTEIPAVMGRELILGDKGMASAAVE